MQTIKAELLIFIGFILVLAGTIMLERPFIIRTYEKAASFGFLCDIAMPGDSHIRSAHSADGLRVDSPGVSSEQSRAHSYNQYIYAVQNRHGFVYEDEYKDPEYEAILNGPCGMMCVIEIPSIHVLLPVGHGTGTDLLRDAAGHLHGTSLPVGGPSTHAVIAAHSGIVDRELFTHLPRMKTGDKFNIYVLGEKHTYIVDKISTCLPSETEALSIVPEEDMITLMTCVPYGINTHRLFVRGVRCVSQMNNYALHLPIARRMEYARSVLYIAGMFLAAAVETAFYALHILKVLSRTSPKLKRSIK